MKNIIVNKSLVLGIIVLMIGAGVVQNIKTTVKADPSDGLVGYWNFDEGTATDQSGNGNHGTKYGGPATVTGISGSALSFDGVDDWIDCGNGASLNPSTAITLAAWYKPTISWYGAGNDPIIDKPYTSLSGPTYQYHLGVCGNLYPVPSHLAVGFDLSPGGTWHWTSAPANTLTFHQWSFIVGTYDGSIMKLYVNGVLKSSKAVSGTISNYGQHLRIAKYFNFYGQATFLPGVIDEVRIYNRALSVSEIQYLHDNPGGSPVNHPPTIQSFNYYTQSIRDYTWSSDRGQINEVLKFTATATDSDSDDTLYYCFYWGDGTSTGWFGPYTSGTPVTRSHSWDQVNVYYVWVKIKDNHDAEVESISKSVNILLPTHTVLVVPTIFQDQIWSPPSFDQVGIRQTVDFISRYYYMQSFGQVHMAFYWHIPIILPKTTDQYDDDPSSIDYYPNQDYAASVNSAITGSYNSLLAIQSYQGNKNFHAQAWWNNSHRSDPYVACVDVSSSTSTITHELGHTVFNLGDLYNDNGGQNMIWDWGLMGYTHLFPPSPLISPEKMLLKWLTPHVYTIGPSDIKELPEFTNYESMSLNDEVPVVTIYQSLEHVYPPKFYLEARLNRIVDNWPSDFPGVEIFKHSFWPPQMRSPLGIETGFITTIKGKIPITGIDSTAYPSIRTKISEAIREDIYWDEETLLKFQYNDDNDSLFDPKVTVSYDGQGVKNMIGGRIVGNVGLTTDFYNDYSDRDINWDLHAYTTDGLHIGLNYTTGEYECQISGAICSGDQPNIEYILVPKGTQVNFQVKLTGTIYTVANYTTQIIESGPNPRVEMLPDGIMTYQDYIISETVLRKLAVGEIAQDIDGDGIPFYQEILDGTNPNDGPIFSPYLSFSTTPPREFAKDSTFDLPIKVKAGDVNIRGATITISSDNNGVQFSNFVDLGDGNYSVTVIIPADYSLDILNIKVNASRTGFINESEMVTILRSLPTTTKIIGSPRYGSNNEWVSSSTEFNLTATDDLSGVDTTFYRIWYSGTWTPWNEYAGNFTLSGEGKHYIEYYSTDIDGNTEAVHNQTHYVDDTVPVVTISASPNSLWPPNHKMKNVLVGGSATDAVSGIASITFTVEDEYDLVEPTLTGFGQTIQLQAMRYGYDMDGRTYTITATATDNLGHIATASAIVLVPHDQGN